MDTHKGRMCKGPARKAWEARIESGQRERLEQDYIAMIITYVDARRWLDPALKFDRDGNRLPKGADWQVWQLADYSSRHYRMHKALACVVPETPQSPGRPFPSRKALRRRAVSRRATSSM